MTSSPLCTVNGTPVAGVGINVSAGSSITIALQDSTGVATWVLSCTSTDELSTTTAINATLVVNQTTKTATATMPSTATGSAVQFTSTVDAGVSTTFGVFVLDPLGTRLFFPGETSESSGSYGVVADLNALGRATVSVPNATNSTAGAIILTKDLGGVYNVPFVVGIQGNPVKSASLGSTQDGYVLTWVNADSKLEFKSLGSISVGAATTTSLGTVQLAGDLGGPGTVATAPIVNRASSSQYGTIELNGDLAGNGSAAAAPTVKNVTGDASGNVTIGASTGITTIAGGIDGYYQRVSTSTDYIIDGYGIKDYIVGTAYSATHTIHLPNPATNKGRMLYIKDEGGNLSATVKMVIAQFASEQIEGVASSYSIGVPGFAGLLICDSTNWWWL